MQRKEPIILSSILITEAQMIGASTIQAIVATSSQKMTVLSNLEGVDLPEGTKIICQVYVKYKRICGECKRIVIEGVGHNIEATLNNKDGSSCAIGNLSDGKEKYLTGIMLAEGAQAALSLSQTSIPTIGGNLLENTLKNKIGQVGINTGSAAADLMRQEYKTTEPIVTLQANSRVIIQFRKGFSL